MFQRSNILNPDGRAGLTTLGRSAVTQTAASVLNISVVSDTLSTEGVRRKWFDLEHFLQFPLTSFNLFCNILGLEK